MGAPGSRPDAADSRGGSIGVRTPPPDERPVGQAARAPQRDPPSAIASIDSTAVNVALPAIGRDLGGGLAAQPAMLVFATGLVLTVSPLTATVLADASDADAGIASAVNNAIARTASLIAVAAIGAAASADYDAGLDSRLASRLPASAAPALTQARKRTFRPVDPTRVPAADRAFVAGASAAASRDAFHLAMGIGAGLLFMAGAGRFALRGRCEPTFAAADCSGGQLVGAPAAAAESPHAVEQVA